MRNLLPLLLMLITLSVSAQKKVLIYTHNGKGYVHENIPSSVEALKKLCKENKYEAMVSDDPSVFTKENLSNVKCVIFSNTNNEAFESDEQKKAFVDYIHGGGGFVGIHSASGSERQWPWFWEMLGGKFVRHPKLQPFKIKVIDQQHPATNFLGEEWQWEDEFYYLDQLNPKNHILLAGELTNLVDEKKGEYPGTTFGNYFPLAWCHEFEGGRQFYTALGHKAEYYQDEKFLKHLLGGIKWTMREK